MDGQPDIYYRRITDGSEELPNNLLAGMLRCRHHANPDFMNLYPHVTFWFVEVTPSRVLREIGFAPLIGAENNTIPIVLAPYERNPGLWTLLNFLGWEQQGTEVEPTTFEAAWGKLLSRLRSDE